MKERVVIVSGFGAFRDYRHDDENPSTPLARQCAAELMARNIWCECVAPVAVNWGESERVITTQIERFRDARVTWIAFGAGRDFAIEMCATNRRAPEQADQSGRFPGKDAAIFNDMTADSDATQAIAMPRERLQGLQDAVAKRGFSLRLSADAGGYICNSAAYALYRAQREGVIENGLFIHTPAELDVDKRVAFAVGLVDAFHTVQGDLA